MKDCVYVLLHRAVCVRQVCKPICVCHVYVCVCVQCVCVKVAMLVCVHDCKLHASVRSHMQDCLCVCAVCLCVCACALGM